LMGLLCSLAMSFGECGLFCLGSYRFVSNFVIDSRDLETPGLA